MRFIVIPVIIAFCPVAFASTEVFFSPADSAQQRLVAGINEAKTSLDIASFQFTSVDIAEALIEAKDRGVRIRILADEKESGAGSSLIASLEDEGLDGKEDIKYLKARFGGRMHHSFIIFDSNAVLTGSYNLTEYSDKFNFENAIFTNDPRLVAKYQIQFNKLYGEPIATTAVPEKETMMAKKGQGRFIPLNLSHLGRLLGQDSMLSDSEKKTMWSHYKDRYIHGEGEIVSSSIDPSTGPTVVIRDRLGTGVEILLDADETDKVSKTSGGEMVGFTGRLIARPGATHNYFKLDRGSLK